MRLAKSFELFPSSPINSCHNPATCLSNVSSRSSPWRGRGASTAISAITVADGPCPITNTRSDNKIASSTSCVTMRTVRRDASQISNNCNCSSRRVNASNAPNGSSRSKISGSIANARAIPTRCCMPPESRLGRRCAACANPTCPKYRSATRVRSALSNSGRADFRPNSILPRAVNHGNNA